MDKELTEILPAEIDVRKVKYIKPKTLGIDFFNEIDAWAKMEFRSSKQVQRLSKNGPLAGHDLLHDLNTIVYAIREKIE